MSVPADRTDAEPDAAPTVELARFSDRLLALWLDAMYWPLLVGIAPVIRAGGPLAGIWGVVSHWGYFALTESAAGSVVTWWEQATWGKYLYGIRVVTTTYRPLSTIRASMRYVVKFVSLVTCIGAVTSIVLIVCTRRKQALHDWITGTMVVCAPVSDHRGRNRNAEVDRP